MYFLCSREMMGVFFIDRDGTHFRYILNYLRDGGISEVSIPNKSTQEELLTEAKFYQLPGLVEYLEELKDQ